MNVTGLMCAYNEEATIGAAVRSLLAAGCERVLVVDGHWGPEFGADPYSTDETSEEVIRAGGWWAQPPITWDTDGGKRAAALSYLRPCDYVFLLDADERVVGTLPAVMPRDHACVMLHNLRENDLPEFRGTFPHGDYGAHVPLLRLLRWSPALRCDGGPGQYSDHRGPIPVYRRTNGVKPIRLLDGVHIEHYGQPDAARIEAKRAYYTRTRS